MYQTFLTWTWLRTVGCRKTPLVCKEQVSQLSVGVSNDEFCTPECG